MLKKKSELLTYFLTSLIHNRESFNKTVSSFQKHAKKKHTIKCIRCGSSHHKNAIISNVTT